MLTMVKNGYLYKLIWIFVKTHHDFIVIYQMFWCFYISMWTEKIDIIESELYWCFFLFNAMVWNPFWSSILVTNSIFLSLLLKLFLIRSKQSFNICFSRTWFSRELIKYSCKKIGEITREMETELQNIEIRMRLQNWFCPIHIDFLMSHWSSRTKVFK